MIPNAFVFFDIGDTIAKITVSGNNIGTISVLPDVLSVLESLRAEEVKLGILSNRGNIEEIKVLNALDSVKLLSFFETSLIIFGPKNSTEIFEHAADVVSKLGQGQNVNQILFVGENAVERAFAQEAGFLVASRPQDALGTLLENQVQGE